MLSETNRIEYKSELNDKLEREVVGFLNYHGGGHIYIGVDADGDAVGIDDIDKIQLQIVDRIKNNILPTTRGLFDVSVEETSDIKIIHITISSGTEKPYYIKKYGMSQTGCFIRLGSSCQPMNDKMILDLFAKRSIQTIITTPANRQDLTFRQLKIYYEDKNLDIGESFERNFEFFTSEGKYNMLAYLFADENSFSFRLAKYAGTDKIDLVENEEYGYCSLIKATNLILEKLSVENRTFAKITSKKRLEKNLVNKVALREAVINAFVHNDYSRGDTPIFEIFSDKIRITSYGGLVEGITQDDFFASYSKPRNREIMRIFKDLNFVEQLGTGTRRILKVYDKSIFEFASNFMFVNLPFEEIVPNGNINGIIKTEKTANTVYNLIVEKPEITIDGLVELIGKSRSTIAEVIEELIQKNKIKRIGSKKTGYWEIL
jgi:predicted HTH transcriptional regulator